MNHGFIFCYWDDPVEWRNEQQAKNNNRISYFEKKQEISDQDIRGYKSGRSFDNNKEKSNNSV